MLRHLFVFGLTPALCSWIQAGEEKEEWTLRPQPFRVTVSVDGVLWPLHREVFRVTGEVWNEHRIEQVIEGGERVEKGAEILRFEREDYERRLVEECHQLALLQRQLVGAEQELTHFQKKREQETRQCEITRQRAEADLAEARETDHPLRLSHQEQQLANARSFLRDSEEELAQLRQMYEADEVTEPTEEIILLQHEDAVKRARHRLEQVEAELRRVREVELPRELVDLEGELDEAREEERFGALEAERNEAQKKAEVEVAKRAVAEAQRKVQQLEADGAQLVWRAPAAGWVHRGEWRDGSWQSANALHFPPVSQPVSVGEALLTFTPEGSPLHFQATLNAVQSQQLQGAEHGLLTVKSAPFHPVAVRWQSLVPRPGHPGEHFLQAELPAGQDLSVGMPATLEVVLGEVRRALLVPRHLVRFQADGTAEVLVKLASGAGEVRPVVLGLGEGNQVAVAEGLEAGQVLLKWEDQHRAPGAAPVQSAPAQEPKEEALEEAEGAGEEAGQPQPSDSPVASPGGE